MRDSSGCKIRADQHPVDGAETRWVAAEPAGAKGRKALGVATQLRRISIVERIENSVQAFSLHLLDPGEQSGTAIRLDVDGRTAGDHRRDALRISNGCSIAMAPPTATPASATVPAIPSASMRHTRSSAIVSMVSAREVFCDNPAPRVS